MYVDNEQNATPDRYVDGPRHRIDLSEAIVFVEFSLKVCRPPRFGKRGAWNFLPQSWDECTIMRPIR